MIRYILSICLSIILVICGSIITVYEFMDYNIINTFEDTGLSLNTTFYDYQLSDKDNRIGTAFTKDPSIVIDNTILEGNMKIGVSYYDNFIKINNLNTEDTDSYIVYLEAKGTNRYQSIKKMIDVTIEGLKKKRVFNYEEALRPSIKIYINEADKDKVRLMESYD